MPEWVQKVWALDQAGKQRALREIELANILAEEGLRRLAKAVDGKTSPLPQRNLVGVHRKDLLLAETMLQLEGKHDLRQLVADGAGVLKKKQFRQLHGERGSAASMLTVTDEIVPGPTHHASVIDAAVLEEPTVFNRQHGLHHVGRDFTVGEQAPFGAVRVIAEPGDELRLELVARKRLALCVDNGGDLAAADAEGCAIGSVMSPRTGLHGDGLDTFTESAKRRSLRGAFGCVAGLAQLTGEETDAEFLPGTDLTWGSVDFCGVGENRLLEPFVDEAAILEVKVAEYAEADKDDERAKPERNLEEQHAHAASC